MGREDRVDQTLRILVETDMAMPTMVIARNLKLRGATFEASSVRRYLHDLHDDGLVVKVDIEALDRREVVEVGNSDDGYWMASQQGRDRIKTDG
jgi:repressor of nif and glnA expression